MASTSLIDNLINTSSKYICRVTIGNSIIPYTRMKKYNVVESDSNEHISMYNLITEQCDEILKTDITQFHLIDTNIVNNIKKELSFVERCKKYYKKMQERGLSDDFFFSKLMTKFNIQYDLIDIVYAFDFHLDEKILRGEDIPDNKFNDIQKAFISLVNKQCETNKQELYELKNDCADSDDLEDIETIIEMFDSCVDEIDFDGVKKIKDMVSCWPPLLMPYPESVLTLVNLQVPKENELSKEEEFKRIINMVNDVDIISSYIEIIYNAKDEIDDICFVKYLQILEKKLSELKENER